jgi:L-fuconolactonase
MAAFPIIDTHLHLWDPLNLCYPWLDGIPLLKQSYLLEGYCAATAGLNIERMVFLQCEVDFSQAMQEAKWVTELAQKDPRIEGIVPWAPLEKGRAARPDLEKLAQIELTGISHHTGITSNRVSGGADIPVCHKCHVFPGRQECLPHRGEKNRLVKGIRRIIQFEPDPEFCLQPGFVEGVRILPEFDFSFDICIAHHQMANTLKFVRQCPEVSFILDHIAKPDIRHQVFEPWKTHLKEFAAMPNVYCKMSGLVVEADMERWTPGDLRPYIDHVLDCFGFDRVMFGGDWPVVLQASTYLRWVETLQAAVAGCSDEEKRKLFHDNAINFYRLGNQ